MAFNGLNHMASGKPPVSIHDESHMLRYWPLAQGTNKQFAELVNSPLDRWGLEKPFSDLGQVHRRHRVTSGGI